MKIRSGRASPQEYCNAHGKSLEEVLSELSEFRRLARGLGVGDVIDGWLTRGSPYRPSEGSQPPDAAAKVERQGEGDRIEDSISQLVARQHILRGLVDSDNDNGRGSAYEQ